MCAQLVAMEVVVWQSSAYLPARLASSWLLVEAPVLSLCWLLALLALTLSVCARLAMWGCRWVRKAEVWKCSLEDEERKDMQQAQNMSCSQAKRRRAARSHQASNRMLSPKKGSRRGTQMALRRLWKVVDFVCRFWKKIFNLWRPKL